MEKGFASFFKFLSKKQLIVIVACLSAIVIVSAFAFNMFQNQLMINGNGTDQHKTEMASLLCEWRHSKVQGRFLVNVTNPHDFNVFGVMAQGQYKNGSLLILEYTPPNDTLEPSESHIISRNGNADDIDNIEVWGYYLVGTDNTD